MNAHKKTIFFVFLLLFPFILLGQEHEKKFPLAILKNPIGNAQWFDSTLKVLEIPYFSKNQSGNFVLLENGYALYELHDVAALLSHRKFVKPVSIDIIFSKYPVRKDDWITNYYQLLADRLLSLFAIDSSLNSNDINWRIVYQTACATEAEAINLFHGIQIGFEEVNLTKIGKRESMDFPISMDFPRLACAKLDNDSEFPVVDQDSLRRVLYPDGVWNRETSYAPPSKNRKKEEPPCPDFRTRMDKPKRRLIDRIFGK